MSDFNLGQICGILSAYAGMLLANKLCFGEWFPPIRLPEKQKPDGLEIERPTVSPSGPIPSDYFLNQLNELAQGVRDGNISRQ